MVCKHLKNLELELIHANGPGNIQKTFYWKEILIFAYCVMCDG